MRKRLFFILRVIAIATLIFAPAMTNPAIAADDGVFYLRLQLEGGKEYGGWAYDEAVWNPSYPAPASAGTIGERDLLETTDGPIIGGVPFWGEKNNSFSFVLRELGAPLGSISINKIFKKADGASSWTEINDVNAILDSPDKGKTDVYHLEFTNGQPTPKYSVTAIHIESVEGVGGVGDIDTPEPVTIINYASSAALLEGQSDYNNASFRGISLSAEYETYPLIIVKGEFQIAPASFVYHDAQGQRIEVENGKDRITGKDRTTFPMSNYYDAQAGDYGIFSVESVADDTGIKLPLEFKRYLAENRATGIPNKAFRWSVDSDREENGIVPDFLTTDEQLDRDGIPQVTITNDAITLKSAIRGGAQVAMPYGGDFRVDVFEAGIRRRTVWTRFEAGEAINVSYPLSAFPDRDLGPISVNRDNIGRVRVGLRPDSFNGDNWKGDQAAQSRYNWDFFVAAQNDASVSGLNDITLETGITRIENFAGFAPGYNPGNRNQLFMFSVEDKSVVSFWDWEQNYTPDNGKYDYVDLRAYKPGTTSFRLLYQGNDGKWYYTKPYTITVNGKILTGFAPPSAEDFTSNAEAVNADGTPLNPGVPVTAASIIISDEWAEDGLIRKPDDGTPFRVWMRDANSLNSLSYAAASRMSDEGSYGPYIATTRDGGLTVEFDKLRPADGATNAPKTLSSGSYFLIYQSADGGGWAGETKQAVAVKETEEDNNGDNGSDDNNGNSNGGCNALIGLAVLAFPLIMLGRRRFH
jgi:hypothetical protein